MTTTDATLDPAAIDAALDEIDAHPTGLLIQIVRRLASVTVAIESVRASIEEAP